MLTGREGNSVFTYLSYLFLTLVALIILIPFYWMVVSAVKPDAELISIPPKFLPSVVKYEHFGIFIENVPFLLIFYNSIAIAVGTTITSVLVSTSTGYALAKYNSRGAGIVLILLLSSSMVPPFIKIIPLYVGMVRIGLNNTLIGVILPFYVNIFGIFFMRQYCLSLPDDILASARIEGASELTTFFRIVFPMVRQACAALAILTFLMTWNNFLWPLIMLSSAKKMTIQVALATLINIDYPTEFGPVMAGATLAVLPITILFLALQRYIISSIAMSGVKG